MTKTVAYAEIVADDVAISHFADRDLAGRGHNRRVVSDGPALCVLVSRPGEAGQS